MMYARCIANCNANLDETQFAGVGTPVPREKVTPDLSRADVLRIAAEANVDPRSVTAELDAMRGKRKRVRGLSGDRIRAALAARR